MILQIFYCGELLKEVDLPGLNSADTKIAFRIESKPQDLTDCVGKPERHANKGKKLIHDKPLIRLPEKEPVRFERVKGIYSNVKNYDNL